MCFYTGVFLSHVFAHSFPGMVGLVTEYVEYVNTCVECYFIYSNIYSNIFKKFLYGFYYENL